MAASRRWPMPHVKAGWSSKMADEINDIDDVIDMYDEDELAIVDDDTGEEGTIGSGFVADLNNDAEFQNN